MDVVRTDDVSPNLLHQHAILVEKHERRQPPPEPDQ